MSGLLLDTPLTEEQREYADAVRVSGDALMAVINDVLDYSKIEAGKLEIESEPFEIRPIVEEISSSIAMAAHAKGVEVITWVDHILPPVVCGDGNRLRQVLANLATNAVKFTATGEIAVQVAGEPALGERVDLRFEVRDTGVGIEPASLDRIFDSFAQQDGSTTRRFGGTGLGLTISKQLVELMGGEIGVRSVPGEGSTFWFTVPVRITHGSPEPPRPEEFKGDRVLVVDDNVTNLTILGRQLTAWGLECDTTADPTTVTGILEEAAQAGRAYRLVLLDSRMPGMTGSELARAIRATPTHSINSLPILMLTSSGNGRTAATEAGVDRFVTKPVHEGRLLREIAGGLSPRRSSIPVSHPPQAVSHIRVPGAGPLLLVAEDNQVNQQVAVALLSKRGYQVDVAANGREAVEMYARGDYEAIFMDCQMPELDGFKATTEIRGHEGSGHRTPIIAMTANTMAGDRERCLAAGMDDYIGKPIRPGDLDAAITRALSGSEKDAAGDASKSNHEPRDDEAPIFEASLQRTPTREDGRAPN